MVGDDGVLLDLARPSHDGVVVVAFGAETSRPAPCPRSRRWLDAGKPVVLATRCPFGEVTPVYAFEGGGARTVAMGVLPAGPTLALPGADGARDRPLRRHAVRRPMSLPASLPIPDEVLEIARTLEGAGHETWCVGGALRDALLEHPHADYDLATAATPAQVQSLFKRTAPVGEKYGTVGVLDRRRVVHEVTTFRRDVATDGRHAVVSYGVSLDDDLARRDFTINASPTIPSATSGAIPSAASSISAVGVVRAVGDPAQRFREDYLRILRAIRFAARFRFPWMPRRGRRRCRAPKA